jgi:hypothetical protein
MTSTGRLESLVAVVTGGASGSSASQLPHVADLRRMGLSSAVPDETDDPPRD